MITLRATLYVIVPLFTSCQDNINKHFIRKTTFFSTIFLELSQIGAQTVMLYGCFPSFLGCRRADPVPTLWCHVCAAQACPVRFVPLCRAVFQEIRGIFCCCCCCIFSVLLSQLRASLPGHQAEPAGGPRCCASSQISRVWGRGSRNCLHISTSDCRAYLNRWNGGWMAAAELLMFHSGGVECSLDEMARLGCGLKTGSPLHSSINWKQSITVGIIPGYHQLHPG